MNILELAPKARNHGSGRRANSDVAYSWHKLPHKGKPEAKGLSFRFSEEILKKARYVDGDRVKIDVSECMKILTFSIGPRGDFTLTGKKKKSESGPKHGPRNVQIKHFGADALTAIFPDKESGQEKINVIDVSSGKITCDMPSLT